MSDVSPLDPTVKKYLDDFSKQTPGVYKWSVGAVSFVSVTAAAATYFKPDSAGLMLGGTVLMVLLIFVLYSIEKGDKLPQFAVLSWFSALVLMLSAIGLLLSIFFKWPLHITFNDDFNDPKYLSRITRYNMSDSYFVKEEDGKHWKQIFLIDVAHPNEFDYVGQSGTYLLLRDNGRKIFVRFPTRGGLLQWSAMTDLRNCTEVPCWVDSTAVSLVDP